MRLAVDANVLVAELLRTRGQALIARPSLTLMIAENVWSEAEYELRKRVGVMTMRGTLTIDVAERILASGVRTANDRIAQIPRAVYAAHERVARSRMPRDPDDWQTVALALAADTAIWTADADFLGCGIATWITETLLAYLAQRERNGDD